MKRLDELKAAKDRAKKVFEELDRVRKLKKDSVGEIEHVVRHGDFEDEAHLKRFADANLRKQLIPAKEAKILKDLEQFEATWPEVWQAARQEWDRWVGDKRDAEFQNLLVAIRPWYGGEEKEAITRREFENVHIPAIAEYRRYFAPDFYSDAATVKDFVEWADLFLAHVDRVIAKTGWKLS